MAKLPTTFKRPSDMKEDAPAGVAISDLADDNSLIVAKRRALHEAVMTSNGPADAVSVDLLVVDGKHAGTREDDRWLFNVSLFRLFAAESMTDGDVVVGRLTWVMTRAGRKAIVLDDPSDADMDVASDAWNGKATVKPVAANDPWRDASGTRADEDEPPF